MIFLDYPAIRRRSGKTVLDQMNRFAPAFGTIGTLIGLIAMPGNRKDPDAIGTGAGAASIAAPYGAGCSPVVFLPFAEKLGYITAPRKAPELKSSCSTS